MTKQYTPWVPSKNPFFQSNAGSFDNLASKLSTANVLKIKRTLSQNTYQKKTSVIPSILAACFVLFSFFINQVLILIISILKKVFCHIEASKNKNYCEVLFIRTTSRVKLEPADSNYPELISVYIKKAVLF